ncbi:hypothetical protein DBT53_002545, partial [Aerococcus mictus]|uniref:hypothetical protein n=1 Tax=Aerococcus mictus TaxID=2976810 RepID=UPI002FD0CAFC
LNTKAKVTVDGVGQSYDSYALIINDAIDTTTRSVEVRLPILNKDYAVKPGLFARADSIPIRATSYRSTGPPFRGRKISAMCPFRPRRRVRSG